jgi:hypothetical protein
MSLQFLDTEDTLNGAALFSHRDLRADGWSVPKPILVRGIPYRLDNESLPEGFRQVLDPHEVPDVVILTEPNSARFLSERLQPALAMVVPVVDFGRGETRGISHLAPRADMFIYTVSRTCLNSLANQIEPMVCRLRQLVPTLSLNPDPETILLARLLVRNRGLVPRHDPGSRNIVEYADRCVFPDLLALAEKLVERGLLKRRLFDALIICPHCDSARVYIRPRPTCTGIESSVLPTTTEQSLGSLCLDCGHEMLVSAAVERPTYAYDLTLQLKSQRGSR